MIEATFVAAQEERICLMCERIDPPCGWDSEIVVEYYDPVARKQRNGSVCLDCDARRMIGAD